MVLGLQLHPFTLGHLFLLIERESPYVTEGREFDWPDFFAAVFLCSAPAADARRNSLSWWVPLWFRLWSLFVRTSSLAKENDRFVDWLREEQVAPTLNRPMEETNRGCNAPSPWVKLMFAMHVLHCTREEAFALRLSELNCLYGTWADWEGRGELTHNPRFDALWDFAQREDAKRFNQDGSRRQDN